MPRHIARWDLDKTYLRTEFDSLRDLVKTAFERADQKRTHPGAATLLREMVRSGMSVHILSGSPEQMRKRLEAKLRLDGIKWDSFTLKPNLENMLRLRFRAVRDQLGYKLPALLQARSIATPPSPEDPGLRHETLFGDDAEADAFVYSLYADTLCGRVDVKRLADICARGKMYPDVLEHVLLLATLINENSVADDRDVVERILIHLERQSPPDEFSAYGTRVVPFYNYLQAAFVLFEDSRVSAETVLRVAVELVVMHRFDGDALAKSYLDLARRGHLRGLRVDELTEGLGIFQRQETVLGVDELTTMIGLLPKHAAFARSHVSSPVELPDYEALVERHNSRRKKSG